VIGDGRQSPRENDSFSRFDVTRRWIDTSLSDRFREFGCTAGFGREHALR
jgi:hypothetical protein